MRNKNFVKKIIGGALIFCLASAVCLIFYFSGIFQKISESRISGGLSFLVENAHTGLANSPGTQMAFNNRSENDNQYAANTPQNKAQGNQTSGSNTIAMGQPQRVLFDISAQPIFGKTDAVNNISWSVISALIFVALLYFIFRVFKKRKLRKIKKINRVY